VADGIWHVAGRRAGRRQAAWRAAISGCPAVMAGTAPGAITALAAGIDTATRVATTRSPGRKPRDTPRAVAEATRRSARSVGKLFLVPERDRRRGSRPATHTVLRAIHVCVKHSNDNGKEQLCLSAPLSW
jgi:hypothetical protein